MPDRSYPSEPSGAALQLFLDWFGPHYARSAAAGDTHRLDGDVLAAEVTVGRRWLVDVTVLDTLTPTSDLEFEAGRAALEQRLDDAELSVALWVPRGASVPAQEPGLSDIVAAFDDAVTLPDGRLEVRRPVTLHLRRTSTTGSVVTVLGGLSAQWAQFTNKVPGSFQLNSNELHRMPTDADERDALLRRVVNAAAQPDVDEGLPIEAFDAWTANRLEGDRAFVLGVPGEETDESAAGLRRTIRRLLKAAGERAPVPGAEARVLVIIGAATYAEDEKLSWTLKGMDPRLYSAFDIITVVADGVVRPLLQPRRGTLPWDAPLA